MMRRHGAVVGGVLGAAMLCVVLGLPGVALGSAMASASIDIKSFVWYRSVVGGTDQVLTASVLGSGVTGQNVVLRGGSDEVALNGGINGSSLPKIEGFRFYLVPGGLGSEDFGPNCSSSGADCNNGLSPIAPPATSQTVNSYGELDGYYAEVAGDSGGLSGGFRSDVSLTQENSSGDSDSEWSSVSSIRSSGNFSTYFRVEFAAQALANIGGDDDTAEAEVVLSMGISGPGIAQDVKEIYTLQTTGGNLQDSDVVLFSYDSFGGMFDLQSGGDYSLTVEATTRSVASTGTYDVPAPSALLLLAGGLLLLPWRRHCLG